MKPLNYAILKHFTNGGESCADDVIEALKGDYAKFKAMRKKAIIEALMTAEANGLIEETRYEMVGSELKIYYHATDENIAVINKYISD